MKFDYCRRFGTEIEVNALDGESHPPVEGAQPDGIQLMANIVAQSLGCRCEIYNWIQGQKATDFNNVWLVKPDGSCGMEICSPVVKGLYGIGQGAIVITALRDSGVARVDNRCSLHIHVEIFDLSSEHLGAVLAHWVKCEYTMLLAMPDRRKKNRYCQPIGMSDLLQSDQVLPPNMLIQRLGAYKYYTANTFHHVRNKRPTVEFRIADEEACIDPDYFRNWHKLIIHFVEMAVRAGYPDNYLWNFPKDVISFLKFDQDNLCAELKETRDWFVRRLFQHAHGKLGGIWDDQVVNRVWCPQEQGS